MLATDTTHREDPATIISLASLKPDEQLRALFEVFWPAYKKWFLREGIEKRPTYAKCKRALREHMPELIGLYDTLCDVLDADDTVARMLGLYRPTPFMTGCSQAIWTRTHGSQPTEIALVRNYDYAPELFEGVNLLSAWTGPRIIGMTDCFWGLLDGMNEHGVCVALAFGGRRVVGNGFAIPLIIRYILETCRTTEQAVEVLQRVPSHMAYNVQVVDRHAAHATVFVSPDRPAHVSDARACANHQEKVEWAEHAQLTKSPHRERYLLEALQLPSETLDSLVSRFFHAPLFLTGRFRKWRTLYTSIYQPLAPSCRYVWMDGAWEQTFDHFVERGSIDDL
jgi:predicted choloylglycine hydrolase